MKPTTCRNLIAVIMFTLVACSSPTAVTTPSGIPAPTLPSYALLVRVDGGVQLKRDGWGEYQATSFGAVLRRGDLLQPSSGANVLVLCGNLTIWHVPVDGPSGLTNGCPQEAEAALRIDESLLVNTRGSVDPSIPYIISPRMTKLLNPTPVFRWNAVNAATQYTIHVWGGDLDWKAQTNQAELVYPSNQSPLKAGVEYLWSVETTDGMSSKEEWEWIPFLGFSLLENDEAQRIKNYSQTLSGLSLPEEGKIYAQAHLYVSHGLLADAIDLLDTQVKSGEQIVAFHQLLGELYYQIALPLMAEDSLLKAVELAQTTGDIESLAAIQANLGKVYLQLGRKDQAVRRLCKARDGYLQLGDNPQVDEIEVLLQELNRGC